MEKTVNNMYKYFRDKKQEQFLHIVKNMRMRNPLKKHVIQREREKKTQEKTEDKIKSILYKAPDQNIS